MNIPQLSLQERDRRYDKVRAEMARQGINCLLLPANTGRWEQLQADSHYLSSIGGFATEVFTVFPLKGDVTAYIFNRAGWWKQAQNWVQDVRDGRNRWGQNAIERINEIGLQKGTIGISGLAGLFRAPEGIIPYSSVKSSQDAFPQAKIVNATEMMQEIRAVESAEQVSGLELSAAIAEKMIDISRACFDAILQAMKPGVSFGALFDVYTRTVEEQGKGRYLWNHPVMHARGLGDDGPALLGDKDLERFSKIELQTGMTFILKPQVRPKEGKGRASIGDTVTVTQNGARRLGKRELKLIVKNV